MIQSDQQIIEQIRAGDTRRFSIIVDRHKERAFTLAVRLVRDWHEAEELVQDGFVRAFRNLDQFRGDSKFSTWLYRIVYNLCMTRVSRRRPKFENVDIQEDMLDNVFVDSDELGVNEQIEKAERQEIVIEEMDCLPEKFRSALNLFYLQEMSYEEMSTVLNLPVGTVKTNLFRGRNLLRERVAVRMKGETV